MEEDVQFVKNVIEDVDSRLCVDEKRVFGVGYTPPSPLPFV